MPRDSSRHRDYDPRSRHDRDRRRNAHRSVNSASELLPHGRADYSESESPSPRKHRYERHERGTSRRTESSAGISRPAKPLSADALAFLEEQNRRRGWKDYDAEERLRKEQEIEDKARLQREREERKAWRAAERERRRAQKEERERREANQVEVIYDEPDDRDHRHERGYATEGAYETERGYAIERGYGTPYEDSPRPHRSEGQRKRRYSDSVRHERRIKYVDSDYDDRRRRKEEKREKKRLAADEKYRKKKDSRRVVSGPFLEEGGNEEYAYYKEKTRDGGSSTEYDDEEHRRKKRKRIWIAIIILVIIAVIAIAVGVTMGTKSSNSDSSSSSSTSDKPSNSNLDGMSESDIPKAAQGTYLDPFTWYDTTDFNVTYTDETVGGLSIMGLNSTWDDNVQANENVPGLTDKFDYGTMPIRGINIGGWLSLEPFITPSFFDQYDTHDGVIDEWTLTSKLGSTKAASTLEQHYSSFVNYSTFADMRDAGFDHVRIPFSYWAVTTYDGDPYVSKISWRYLLRGIEYARQNGLRVNLDLHGIPGSQNGWNHSGRQGVVGWLNGTDGDLNAQRSLDIHNQLSQFFAQPRYKNLVTMYGLVNEPRMVVLDTNSVLNWTTSAIEIVRKNNITGVIVFGDGFMGLDNWQGKLTNEKNLLLDVHQYVIFNVEQIVLNHTDKLTYACKGWTAQMLRSENTATGFGPTMCGEWSQADTDCAQYINNVGVGSRWEGTMNTGNESTSVLDPTCPTNNNPQCECDDANADPSKYSDEYKQWLLAFAIGQMESFEQGWGWFHWTWQTESATQWSYKAGMAAGIMPAKVWDRPFSCNSTIPDYASLGLAENY